eukprot:739475-Rhodomonas_salina.1
MLVSPYTPSSADSQRNAPASAEQRMLLLAHHSFIMRSASVRSGMTCGAPIWLRRRITLPPIWLSRRPACATAPAQQHPSTSVCMLDLAPRHLARRCFCACDWNKQISEHMMGTAGASAQIADHAQSAAATNRALEIHSRHPRQFTDAVISAAFRTACSRLPSGSLGPFSADLDRGEVVRGGREGGAGRGFAGEGGEGDRSEA